VILQGAVIGRKKYKTTGVNFDRDVDWMARSSALSGISNGAQGTVSFWVRHLAGNSQLQNVFNISEGTSQLVNVLRASSTDANRYFVICRTAGLTQLINIRTAAGVTVSSGWVHVIASWNAGSAAQMYLNDVSSISITTNTAGTIKYDGDRAAVGRYAHTIGTPNPPDGLDGDLADFWFTPTFIDLSVGANRRKFVTAGVKPVDLGANGQLPTGSSPAVFIKGPAASFDTNLGTGGNFTVTGTLTNATTSPSD
jgi:hypothetical protein